LSCALTECILLFLLARLQMVFVLLTCHASRSSAISSLLARMLMAPVLLKCHVPWLSVIHGLCLVGD